MHGHFDPNDLIAIVASEDGKRSSDAAFALARAECIEAVPVLRRVLSSTDDSRIRNACAIALSDLRDEGCVELIARLLRDPRTAGHRGSLVYALENFDSRPLFSLLVEIAAMDGFEARHEAFGLLCAIEGDIDPAVLGDAKIVARDALKQAPDERRNSNLDLVELLEEFG
jgi:HEAT repeat protein